MKRIRNAQYDDVDAVHQRSVDIEEYGTKIRELRRPGHWITV
jgi:hypothetical protein